MAPNAHSVNDVPAEPACVGGTQERSEECTERRPQPSSRRSDGVGRRRSRRADLDCLGRSGPGSTSPAWTASNCRRPARRAAFTGS